MSTNGLKLERIILMMLDKQHNSKISLKNTLNESLLD